MYELRRIFCATPWELEPERQALYEEVAIVNESTGIGRGILYVPVSLINMGDKRPLQYTVDDNIRECSYYVLALSDGWGPPERNFERDFRLALKCLADPTLPMRQVVCLRKHDVESGVEPQNLPPAVAEFETMVQFRERVRGLLQEWILATP